jgi:hypothetical protein
MFIAHSSSGKPPVKPKRAKTREAVHALSVFTRVGKMLSGGFS